MYVNPKLLIYPSLSPFPFSKPKFVSKSVKLFLFCKFVHDVLHVLRLCVPALISSVYSLNGAIEIFRKSLEKRKFDEAFEKESERARNGNKRNKVK